MNIEKAKQLKIGQIVYCPADRGDAAYAGRVEFIDAGENKTSTGEKYIWVHVRGPHHATVWPSNRLGAAA